VPKGHGGDGRRRGGNGRRPRHRGARKHHQKRRRGPVPDAAHADLHDRAELHSRAEASGGSRDGDPLESSRPGERRPASAARARVAGQGPAVPDQQQQYQQHDRGLQSTELPQLIAGQVIILSIATSSIDSLLVQFH
jgi:hypothetical protein